MRLAYGEKIDQKKNGTYHGNSPFYNNIPEFQFLKPLASYPHLRGFGADERDAIEQRRKQAEEFRRNHVKPYYEKTIY